MSEEKSIANNENEKSLTTKRSKWLEPPVILQILVLIVLIVTVYVIYYVSLDDEFTVSCSSMGDIVCIGHQIRTKVKVESDKYERLVKLSSTGAVDGMKISFNPPIGIADNSYESEMVIYVDDYVPDRKYIISIIGSGTDGTTHSCEYEFDVFVLDWTKDTPIKYLFRPTGFMGDLGDITINEHSTNYPHSLPTCIEINYSASNSHGHKFAGIYWLFPKNNWGKINISRNLNGAKSLKFLARGAIGGEVSEFKFGGNGFDSSSIQKPLTTGKKILTESWKEFEIDLTGVDLSKVIGGFCWVTNIDDNPEGCRIYLDDIRFSRSEVNQE